MPSGVPPEENGSPSLAGPLNMYLKVLAPLGNRRALRFLNAMPNMTVTIDWHGLGDI